MTVRPSPAAQVVWVWILFISFCIPEVFTFLRSMRMVCFKSPVRATLTDTFVVVAMESMSMVGLGLLAFYVWPNLDVIKGAMLTNCVAFMPGVHTDPSSIIGFNSSHQIATNSCTDTDVEIGFSNRRVRVIVATQQGESPRAQDDLRPRRHPHAGHGLHHLAAGRVLAGGWFALCSSVSLPPSTD